MVFEQNPWVLLAHPSGCNQKIPFPPPPFSHEVSTLFPNTESYVLCKYCHPSGLYGVSRGLCQTPDMDDRFSTYSGTTVPVQLLAQNLDRDKKKHIRFEIVVLHIHVPVHAKDVFTFHPIQKYPDVKYKVFTAFSLYL